jgi:copper homeostasis protein
VFLEVCVTGPDGLCAARDGGARRVELCSALELAGLTPGDGLLRTCLEMAGKEVAIRVLVRPRPGDFCYSGAEFSAMLADVERCRELGAEGVVSGVLLPDGRIDEERTRRLVEAAGEMGFTFHRAFDQAADPHEALETVIRCGADTLLTSGQCPAAPLGAPLLADLVRAARNRLQILAGGGIRPDNLGPLLGIGLAGIHASASKKIESPMRHRSSLPMNAVGLSDYESKATDPETIRELLARIPK